MSVKTVKNGLRLPRREEEASSPAEGRRAFSRSEGGTSRERNRFETVVSALMVLRYNFSCCNLISDVVPRKVWKGAGTKTPQSNVGDLQYAAPRRGFNGTIVTCKPERGGLDTRQMQLIRCFLENTVTSVVHERENVNSFNSLVNVV